MAIQSGFTPSGLTQDSFFNMVTGAGALYYGIDYDDVTPKTTKAQFAKKLQEAKENNKALGATDGGCTVAMTPRIRQITVDDLLQPIAGSTVMDGWENVTISTTAKETTKKKIEQVMSTARVNTKTGALEFGSSLTSDHFDNEVTLAVRTIGDTLMVFRLKGALNTSGLSITTTSGGEGTYAVSFSGHLKDLADIERDIAPLSIYEFAADGMVKIDPGQGTTPSP